MNMKVLICDDEQLICDLIQHLIDWEKYGCELVGIVHSGLEAMDFIKINMPDIVITDIRMPDMDGLHLVKKISEMELDIHFIIISGYKNFDYAYDAIRFGVENYLLKPIKASELIECLQKISNDRAEKEVIEKRLLDSSLIVKNNLMEMILTGRDMTETTFTALCEANHFRFQSGYYSMLIFQIDAMAGNTVSEILKLQHITGHICQMIENTFIEDFSDIAVCVNVSRIYVLVNYGDKKEINSAYFKKMYLRICSRLSIDSLYMITLGVGVAVESITDVSCSLKSAVNAINSRLMLGCGKIIQNDGMDSDSGVPSRVLSRADWNDLDDIIEHLNVTRLSRWLDEYYGIISDYKSFSNTILFDCASYFLDRFCDVIQHNAFYFRRESGKTAEDAEGNVSLPEIANMPMNDVKIFEETLKAEVTGYLTGYAEAQKSKEIIPIKKAKLFIISHISEDICLDVVAEYVGLNPVYFSALFKKETGINYIQYIINERIERSKRYMRETELSIQDIARRVGYYDTRYFSKLFKKENGVTPQQYRKMYGRSGR